ncbi:S24 family peptidase [Rhizobium sp. XQZ8]|uniref:S24 family peptidase n=1 Tax=Rhizobium populisoli TaxID=2859785 RepID=UPI001CA502DC|nr:S24 family peptidase [Rhizobium populisoli]MBW6421044.1 S24 family peptidase [Rhizobium populisoli]
MHIPVHDPVRRRKIEKALSKFSQNWAGLDDRRRATAIKVLILCELLGGRGRVVELLDLKDNTLDNYRHGRTEPRHSTLNAMAEHAGVPIEFLGHDWSFEGGEIRVLSPEPSYTGFSEVSALGEASPFLDIPDRIIIPGYDEIRTPGGQSSRYTDILVAIPQAFLARIEVDPANLRILSAKGDSMAPTIFDGAPLLVDTSDRKLQDGRIYAFDVDGEVLLRRIQRLPSGDIELLPDNVTRYRPQLLEKHKIMDLTVLGRVCSGTWIL